MGEGVTHLFFYRPDGQPCGEATLADAATEAAFAADCWLVGCRDGNLYSFTTDGHELWRWSVPGSQDAFDSPYARPSPYRVAADSRAVVCSSTDRIFSLRRDGELRWEARLTPEVRFVDVWVPFESDGSVEDALSCLGLPDGAAPEDIKSAYRRVAKETHPDVRPDDAAAVERFRMAHSAYELLIADAGRGGRSQAGRGGMRVAIPMPTMPPWVSFIDTRYGRTLVGTTRGQVLVYDEAGSVEEVHVLGNGTMGPAALHSDGSLAAVWGDGALFYFADGKPTSSIDLVAHPAGLRPMSDGVVMWEGKNLRIVDRSGSTTWDVDFARYIAGVALAPDEVVCAAGPVAAFTAERFPR